MNINKVKGWFVFSSQNAPANFNSLIWILVLRNCLELISQGMYLNILIFCPRIKLHPISLGFHMLFFCLDKVCCTRKMKHGL